MGNNNRNSEKQWISSEYTDRLDNKDNKEKKAKIKTSPNTTTRRNNNTAM
jgi:hypothetical protein